MRNSSRPCFLALDGGSRGLRLAAPGFGQRCWGPIEVGGRRDGRCLVPPPSVMLQLWAEPFPQGSSGHALAGLSVTLLVGSLCRLLAVKSFLGPLSSLDLQISVKHKFLSWIMVVEGAGRCSPSRGGPEQYLGNAFCWGPVVTCPHGPHRREASYGKNSTLSCPLLACPVTSACCFSSRTASQATLLSAVWLGLSRRRERESWRGCRLPGITGLSPAESSLKLGAQGRAVWEV